MKQHPSHDHDHRKRPHESIDPQTQQPDAERNRHDKQQQGSATRTTAQSPSTPDTRDGQGVKPEPGAKLGNRHGGRAHDDADDFGNCRR